MYLMPEHPEHIEILIALRMETGKILDEGRKPSKGRNSKLENRSKGRRSRTWTLFNHPNDIFLSIDLERNIY